jgi:hypothetical protein
MVIPPSPRKSNPLPQICPKCSAQLQPNSTNCEKCGAVVEPALNAQPQPIADSAATPPATPAVMPAPTPTEPKPSDGFSVGIWGTKSAGKTMYLGMLRINIMRQYQPMWRMTPWNEDASRFIGMVDVALADHRFTPPTLPDQPDNLWFQISKRDPIHHRDQTYSLRVLDMPGEWYQNPEKAVINGVNVLQEYLANCQGLLCLVDPDSSKQERMNIYLGELLRTLFLKNNRQPIDKWFAFCLTKMDLPAHRAHCHNPTPYVQQKLGSMLLDNLHQYCIPGRVRFDFACSAVGFYPGIKPERSNSGIDWEGNAIIYETDRIQPFGLLEPLGWLFSGIKPV